jgi:hypothetical protein
MSSSLSSFAFLFTGLSCYWVGFSCWWYFNTKRFYSQLQLIHRYVFMTLVLRSLYCIFTACLYYSEQNGGVDIYWLLVCACTFTLYNTFTFTILLLLSKGFFITRFVLTRPEITSLAVSMGVIYLAFSAYILASDALYIILIVVIIFTCFRVVTYSRVVISNLTRRLAILISSDIEPLVRSVQAKLRLIRTFQGTCVFYFGSQVVMYSIFFTIVPESTTVSWEYDLISVAVEQLCELLAVSLIFILFRARRHEQFFTLPDFSGLNDQFELPPIYKAEVVTGSYEVSEAYAGKPIVFLTPEMQENLGEVGLKSILIGVEVKK